MFLSQINQNYEKNKYSNTTRSIPEKEVLNVKLVHFKKKLRPSRVIRPLREKSMHLVVNHESNTKQSTRSFTDIIDLPSPSSMEGVSLSLNLPYFRDTTNESTTSSSHG